MPEPWSSHIDPDGMPWVHQSVEGFSFDTRILQARDDGLLVAQTQFAPDGHSSLHRHLAPVFAITTRGRWGHRAGDFPYGPGTYVYEPVGVVHQFFSGPEPVEATFISLGDVEYVDPATGVVITRQSASTELANYYEQCEQQGLPRPNVLR